MESGTHEELIRREGPYARLYDMTYASLVAVLMGRHDAGRVMDFLSKEQFTHHHNLESQKNTAHPFKQFDFRHPVATQGFDFDT